MKTEIEYSAGGVLFRRDEEEQANEVCLIKVRTRGGNPSWRLPKGWIEPDETSEDAAVRETLEETGCVGEIIAPLSDIEYWYTRRGDSSGERIRVQKNVDFYLMSYLHGSVDDHDDEVEEARWFTIPRALESISYDAESRVLQEAIHTWDAYLYHQTYE
jgi:8-oxo-dGTP diphosphatase